MKKKKTLRKNYEFKKVLTKGKMYAGEQILIYISQNKLNENLIGIAISSKLCNAVKRNTITVSYTHLTLPTTERV